MAKKHPKRSAMIKYILLFFFSMEKHAKECYEVEIIFRLFNEKLEKGLYRDWIKIRTVIAKLLNINMRNINKLILSENYLKRHQTFVVAERAGHESQEEIAD
jgi:undecaprenyl pyrophosphate synthase